MRISNRALSRFFYALFFIGLAMDLIEYPLARSLLSLWLCLEGARYFARKTREGEE